MTMLLRRVGYCASCGERKPLRQLGNDIGVCSLRCAAGQYAWYPAPWEGRRCNDCGHMETDCQCLLAAEMADIARQE